MRPASFLKALLLICGTVCFGIFLFALVDGKVVALLHPAGAIAAEQKRLIYIATILMALIVVPVLLMTAGIAWRFRATNTKAKYLPNWEHSAIEEFIWWAVPCVIIIFLAGLTWTSSHELDPFKPIAHDTPTIRIQAVALDWKWLFIYPDEGVASVNFMQFPVDTPLALEITADAPMNSFWIPRLGGQIYAMPGMVTKLHLIANESGDFGGLSANFSGPGFSGMRFLARASSLEEYEAWLASARSSSATLDTASYKAVARPSMNEPVVYYSYVEDDLFRSIMEKFMAHDAH